MPADKGLYKKLLLAVGCTSWHTCTLWNVRTLRRLHYQLLVHI